MKKMVFRTAALLAVALSIFLIPTLWFKPWSIDHFYSRVFLEYALRHPAMLTQLRLLEPMGLDFHSDDLDDMSLEFARYEREQTAANLAMLRRYERDGMGESGRLSYDVLEFFFEDMVRGEPFALHDYPINQLQGWQSTLPQFMISYHLVENEGDAESYIARLGKFGTFYDQIIEGLGARQAIGVVPPRFVLELVLRDLREFVAKTPREGTLFEDLSGKLDKLEDLAADRRSDLEDQAAATIETVVLPAYQRLIDVLDAQLQVATDDDGVWKLPDGEAYYAHRLRSYTTTEMSAEAIHQLGLEEVARLQAEMLQILNEQGIEAETVGAGMQTLLNDPRFLFPDTDAGRDAILTYFREIVAEFESHMPTYFDPLPSGQVVIEAVPEFVEATSPVAYYEPGSFDGKKPGTFFANLRSVEEHAKFGMRTLAYHEAVPGHHLQLTLAQQMEGVPFFRRILPFTAYIEGWALYAEKLAAELGFQDDPFDRLGYLQDQMFRAVRLVVDTGIHHKRWTRQQAIDYMAAHTGLPDTEVVSEIERYIVDPGQACAYKVGQLKILELRERARAAFGPDFDLRAFHRVVLGQGSVPLVILEEIVDRWIAEGT